MATDRVARDPDRPGVRTWHYIVPSMVGVLGLLLAALNLTGSPVLALTGFTLGAIGCLSTLPVFWSQARYGVGRRIGRRTPTERAFSNVTVDGR